MCPSTCGVVEPPRFLLSAFLAEKISFYLLFWPLSCTFGPKKSSFCPVQAQLLNFHSPGMGPIPHIWERYPHWTNARPALGVYGNQISILPLFWPFFLPKSGPKPHGSEALPVKDTALGHIKNPRKRSFACESRMCHHPYLI